MKAERVEPGGPDVPHMRRSSGKKEYIRVEQEKKKIKLPACKELTVILRDIALQHPTQTRIQAGKKELVGDLDFVLGEVKNARTSLDSAVSDLKSSCLTLKLDPVEVLINRFKNSDEEKQAIVLKMLPMLQVDSSDFVVKVLESRGCGYNYKFCLEFLSSLDKEHLGKFICSIMPSDESKQKLDNLAKSILAVAKDDNFVFETLKKDYLDLYRKDDSSFYDVEYKQLLLLAVIRNMKLSVTVEDIKEQYTHGISLLALDTICDLVQKNPDTLIEIAVEFNEELRNADRTVAIRKYAKFLGKGAVPELKKIILNNDDPILMTALCDVLVSCCGKEGVHLLEEIITNSIFSDNPSLVLATVAYLSKGDKNYDLLLERIFSADDFDVKDALLKIHNSKLKIGSKLETFLGYDLGRASLPSLVRKIGLEDRFVGWIQKGGDLGRNSGRVLLEALKMKNKRFNEYIADFMADTERSASLRKSIDMK